MSALIVYTSLDNSCISNKPKKINNIEFHMRYICSSRHLTVVAVILPVLNLQPRKKKTLSKSATITQ